MEESVTKLSIAIRLKDDFTEAEPIGNVTVSIKGLEKEPFKNLNGYHIFTDLPRELHEVKVAAKSDFYLERDTDRLIAWIPDNPVVEEITLKPHCAYPFPVGSTLLRAVVRKEPDPALPNQDPFHQAIPKASVKAIVFLPESITTATARVGQGGAAKGTKIIHLESFTTGMLLNVGDVLMIEEPNTDKMEFCQIVAPLPKDPSLDPYNLEDRLKFDHSTGTPLFLMKDQNEELATRTDEKGEMVMYFKRNKASKFLIQVTISKEGYQDKKLDKVEISEGTTKSLGVIELSQ
ncbi:hypothetical protein [Brevibacillus sp. SYSU BS000544]|uniref:hypothetical protein n=1 Tax=Brevibacillus sp. SYSU BS000544 TaxID=3416443 RepID=UPI003CE4E7AC